MKNRTICATQNEQIEWIEHVDQKIHETKQRNRRLNAIKQQLETLGISNQDFNFGMSTLSGLLFQFICETNIRYDVPNVTAFLYIISNYRITRWKQLIAERRCFSKNTNAFGCINYLNVNYARMNQISVT